MPPRERIIAAFRRQVPNRTPTDGWFHAETQKRLKEQYQMDNWESRAGLVAAPAWFFPNPP